MGASGVVGGIDSFPPAAGRFAITLRPCRNRSI